MQMSVLGLRCSQWPIAELQATARQQHTSTIWWDGPEARKLPGQLYRLNHTPRSTTAGYIFRGKCRQRLRVRALAWLYTNLIYATRDADYGCFVLDPAVLDAIYNFEIANERQ